VLPLPGLSLLPSRDIDPFFAPAYALSGASTRPRPFVAPFFSFVLAGLPLRPLMTHSPPLATPFSNFLERDPPSPPVPVPWSPSEEVLFARTPGRAGRLGRAAPFRRAGASPQPSCPLPGESTRVFGPLPLFSLSCPLSRSCVFGCRWVSLEKWKAARDVLPQVLSFFCSPASSKPLPFRLSPPNGLLQLHDPLVSK